MEDNIENTNYIIKLHEKADNFIPKEENMKDEYEFFKNYIDNDDEHKNNLNPGESKLDRYKDIKPYKNNTIEINKNKENKNHYINASGINNKFFITTQAPKPQKTIEDFWTMIDENECRVIIMLCNEKENGKEKCAKYWDKGILMNNYRITIQNKTQKGKYIIREIKLINLSLKKEKIVYQIHFIAWPDHGVPKIEEGKIFNVFVEMIANAQLKNST